MAKECGLDIEKATFIVGGESLINIKHNEISSVGARVVPEYAFAEVGPVGFGYVKHEDIFIKGKVKLSDESQKEIVKYIEANTGKLKDIENEVGFLSGQEYDGNDESIDFSNKK